MNFEIIWIYKLSPDLHGPIFFEGLGFYTGFFRIFPINIAWITLVFYKKKKSRIEFIFCQFIHRNSVRFVLGWIYLFLGKIWFVTTVDLYFHSDVNAFVHRDLMQKSLALEPGIFFNPLVYTHTKKPNQVYLLPS